MFDFSKNVSKSYSFYQRVRKAFGLSKLSRIFLSLGTENLKRNTTIKSGGGEKKYHFAWNDMESDNVSDVTISSVHTSDLSNFEDDYETSAFEESDGEQREQKDENVVEMKNAEEKVNNGRESFGEII